jgi:hypothetical protein
MIALVVTLAVVGLCLYLIETFIPMSPPFKIIIRVVVVVFSILYILRAFGFHDLPVR